jgi:capsular exopolysaccharide synthesis family protein
MQLVQAPSPAPLATVGPPPLSEGWGDEPTLAPPRSPFERPLAAVRRYKWLLLCVMILSITGGVVATKLVRPEYEASATIWIASETPLADKTGPVRTRQLLSSGAWVELLKSYRISDAVVKKLSLYIQPKSPGDSIYLNDISVGEKFVPGLYTLAVQKRATRWKLSLEETPVSDSGAVGDSIGRPMGIRWKPSAARLAKLAGHEMKFTIATPRETSVELMKRLSPKLQLGSNFLWLKLTDQNPTLAARTLNTWVTEYVAVAGDLKRKNMVEFSKILEGQLQFAETSLHDAESTLETFRVHTITLPTEGGTPVAPGLEMTRDPAMRSFFDKKIEYENLKHDREALERALAAGAAGTGQYEAILLIPSVVTSPASRELQSSFDNLYKQQAELAAKRQQFTDNFVEVKELIASVNTTKNKTIPAQANALLLELREKERDFETRISGQSSDLQAIPARTIEEMRLRRQVAVAEGLYTTLKSRFAEAKLGEESASPDVNILDSAVAPLLPTANTAPRIMTVAVVAGLAAAIGLAILLDGLDKRIRYPEQASKDLGLTISGTVPQLPKGGVDQQRPEQISQLVESFRTLRMNVMNSSHGQVLLAVSSPSPGDGKSFIASNLAMSFADAGFKTLLIDADTRRGALHDLFGMTRSAGLTDYLAGEATQSAILHPTGQENLTLIPTGAPRRRSPELLTSPQLTKLVSELRTKFDVVIFDTPPLAAGIDAYAVASAAGHLLVVLRIGQTERRMAAAKLLLVDRLPITVVGTVLNAAPTSGEYEYYGYTSGYGTEELEPGQQVARIS